MSISRQGATLFAILAVAWALTLRATVDPDLFWHLRVGESVLDRGAIPTVESWSWIAAGRTFYPHSWLFDVVLTLLYRAGGLYAVGLLGALLGGIAVALLYRLARAWHGGLPAWTAAGATLGAVLLAAPVWSPRAQVLDLIGSLLVLLLLERGSRQRRALLWLPLLGLAWANLHGAGILAGALAGGAFLLARLVRGERRELLPPLGAAALTGLAAIFSPMGLGIFTYPLETLVSPVQQALINEWQPIRIDTTGGLFILFLLSSIWLGRQLHAPRLDALMLALFWTWQALGSVRYILFGGPFLALLLLPGGLATLEPRLTQMRDHLTARGFTPLRARVPLLIGILIASMLALPRLTPNAYDGALTRYPVAASEFLVAQECRGRIANAYGWGGYLIWHWGEPVGHYGAADAFGDELLRPYQERLNRLTEDPAPWLTENGVTLALFTPREPISRWLDAAGWEKLYADETAVLYAAPSTQPCR